MNSIDFLKKLCVALIIYSTLFCCPVFAVPWEFLGPTFPPKTAMPISAMHIYPDGTILAASSKRIIYKSKDQGKTWDTLANTIPSKEKRQLSEAFGRLWLISIEAELPLTAVMYSSDSGKTWNNCDNYPSASMAYCMTTIGNTMYVGSGSRIHYSSDTGKTWKTHIPLSANAIMNIVQLNDTFWINNYTGIDISNKTFSFWEWIPSAGDRINDLIKSKYALIAGSYFGVAIKKFNAPNWLPVLAAQNTVFMTNDTTIFAHGKDTFSLSTNGGLTWKSLGPITELFGINLGTYAMLESKDYYLCATPGGIYRIKKDFLTPTTLQNYKISMQSTNLFNYHNSKDVITVSSANSKPFSLSVYNIKGQLQYSKHCSQSSITIHNVLISNGLLFLEVRQGNKKEVIKF